MSRVIFLADAVDPVTATTIYGKSHQMDLADEVAVRTLNNQGKLALMGADIRKPRAPVPTTTGCTITFSLDQVCTAVAVNYGTTAAYGSTQAAVPPTQGPGDIGITLSGLTTGTLYHYRVTATVGTAVTNTPDQTFSTL